MRMKRTSNTQNDHLMLTRFIRFESLRTLRIKNIYGTIPKMFCNGNVFASFGYQKVSESKTKPTKSLKKNQKKIMAQKIIILIKMKTN